MQVVFCTAGAMQNAVPRGGGSLPLSGYVLRPPALRAYAATPGALHARASAGGNDGRWM